MRQPTKVGSVSDQPNSLGSNGKYSINTAASAWGATPISKPNASFISGNSPVTPRSAGSGVFDSPYTFQQANGDHSLVSENPFKYSKDFLLSLFDIDLPLPSDFEPNEHATLSSPNPPLANIPLTELEKKLFSMNVINPTNDQRRSGDVQARYSHRERDGRFRGSQGPKRSERFGSPEREKDEREDQWDTPSPSTGNFGEKGIFNTDDKIQPLKDDPKIANKITENQVSSPEKDPANGKHSPLHSPLLAKGIKSIVDSPELLHSSPRNVLAELQDPIDNRISSPGVVGRSTPTLPIGTPNRENISESLQRHPQSRNSFDPFSGRALRDPLLQPLGKPPTAISPEIESQLGNRWTGLGLNTADPLPIVESINLQWEYKDPTGTVHGPFTPLQMHDWYLGGFFDDSLPIKRSDKPNYEPLIRLIQKYGREKPFIFDASEFELTLKMHLQEKQNRLRTLSGHQADPFYGFPSTSALMNGDLPDLIGRMNFGSEQRKASDTTWLPPQRTNSNPWGNDIGLGFGRGSGSMQPRIPNTPTLIQQQLQQLELLDMSSYSPIVQQQLLLEKQRLQSQVASLFAPPQNSFFEQYSSLLANNELGTASHLAQLQGLAQTTPQTDWKNPLLGSMADPFVLQQQQSMALLQQQQQQLQMQQVQEPEPIQPEPQMKSQVINKDVDAVISEVKEEIRIETPGKVVETLETEINIEKAEEKNVAVEPEPNIKEVVEVEKVENRSPQKAEPIPKIKRGKSKKEAEKVEKERKVFEEEVVPVAEETEVVGPKVEEVTPKPTIPAWTKPTTPAQKEPKLTLKEIQEIEERERKEREQEKTEAARRQMLAQAAYLAEQEQLAQQSGVTSGSVWGSGSTTTNTQSTANVVAKGVVRAKTLMEIMQEEEIRKKKEMEKRTAQISASGYSGATPVIQSDTTIKRFADAVGTGAASTTNAWGTTKPAIKVASTANVVVQKPPISPEAVKTDQASAWSVVGKQQQATTVRANVARPTTTVNAVDKTSTKPSETDPFVLWCRNALKGVAKGGGNVNVEEFIQILISIPINEPSTIMMICDDTLGGVTSIDARKFGEEFIRRRREGVVGTTTNTGVATTSLAGMQMLARPIEDLGTGNRFVTVGKNKKKKKGSGAFLIENGSNSLNSLTIANETPLSIASRNGYYRTARYLIEVGEEVDIEDFDGDTALTKAVAATAMKESVDLVELLLARGANVNHLTKSGDNVFRRCVRTGTYRMLEFLVGKVGSCISQFLEARNGIGLNPYEICMKNIVADENFAHSIEMLRFLYKK
ncbi:hypothetical protein HK098_001934 [Nowakowskiella sp. JEL0407]|nr:hypothetical protein HK098_001934 [Nowakowskiella sp. JEL0407]